MIHSLTFNYNKLLSNKIPDKVKRFLYSDWYLLILTVLCFSSWVANLPWLGFATITVFGTVILIILDDLTPVIPLAMFAPFVIPSSENIQGYLSLIYIFIPLIIAAIFHVVYYRKKFHLGKMFYPQLSISVAMIVAGCTSIALDRYVGALGYTFMLGPMILIAYFLFYNYSMPNKFIKGTDYVAKMLMYMGILMVAQIIVFYVRVNVPPANWGKINVDLGWCISNNAATLLLLCAPMCFYLGAKSKFILLYALIGVVEYIGVFLTFSRGGILFAVITGVVVVIYTLVKAEYKKNTYIAFGITVAAILIFYFSIFNQANDAIRSLLAQGVGGSGRKELYIEALQSFMKHPIFGVGMGFNGKYYPITTINFYWFHSTLFQIVGSTGLIGICAFLFLYIRRYKIIFKNVRRNKWNGFMLLTFLGFELYSMIDTGTFIPMPFMLLMMLLTMVAEKEMDLPITDKGHINVNEEYKREIAD